MNSLLPKVLGAPPLSGPRPAASFRLFACMNPPTDVGKKDLPPALRSRFTEIYVQQIGKDQEGCFRFWNDEVVPRLDVA